MNLHTELLEKRIAQLKVGIEIAELDKAKVDAARTLSKRVNIPGFRKGKAPYNVVSRYLGESAIFEEAIDQLGSRVYKEALEQSELEPYGPGQLEDVKVEDELLLTFHVPLTPRVELGNYREVRRDYEPVVISDEQVEEVVTMMRSNKAETAVKEGPAEKGDQVRMSLYAVPVVGEGETVAEENKELLERPLFDLKDWLFVLGETIREPVPGFSEAITGMAAGDTRTFTLTLPEGDDVVEVLRGRPVNFTVTCLEVSARTLPELNDDFVKNLGEEGVETVSALYERIREDLHNTLGQQNDAAYADAVLDTIVEETTIEYPDMMLEEFVDEAVENLERRLKQDKLTLEAYLDYFQKTEEDLRNEFRPSAEKRLKRSLTVGALVRAEGLEVDERTYQRAVSERSNALSYGSEELRAALAGYLFEYNEARVNLTAEVLSNQIMERVVAIAKGENPPTGPTPFVEDEVAASESVEQPADPDDSQAEVIEATAEPGDIQPEAAGPIDSQPEASESTVEE